MVKRSSFGSQLVILFLAIIVLIAFISEGKLPPLDPAAISTWVSNFFGTSVDGVGTIAWFALLALAALLSFLAVIAPIIFAVRSSDIITVLISIILVLVTWAIVITTNTITGYTLAGIVYLASITLSAIVFAAERIARRNTMGGRADIPE